MPAIGTLLAHWRLVLIGLLVAALAIQTIRLERAENALIADRLAQAEAIRKAQDAATKLSDELIIAQAAAMAVTEKKVTRYVDRIRTVQAPDTACATDERMRIGNGGVRDLIRGGDSKAIGGAFDPVPRSGPGAGPR